MNSKRILFAEDNPNDAELTLSVFAERRLSGEVEVVGDGVEALDYLTYRGRFAGRARRNPQLVLLDLKMPRIDGLRVLKSIRENDELSMVPVVILSSSRESSDISQGYDLGANAYVVKPVDFEEFATAIGAVAAFWVDINEAPPLREVR